MSDNNENALNSEKKEDETLSRPPEIDAELHKEIKLSAVNAGITIRQAYENFLKRGLEKYHDSAQPE